MDLNEDLHSSTPLLMAADMGDIGMVRLLHTNGGNINHADEWGSTALHRAVKVTNLELTKYLLKHNSDVHKQDSRGNIALELAAQVLAAPFRCSHYSYSTVLSSPQEKAKQAREIYTLLLERVSNKLDQNNEGNAPIEIY